MFWDGRRKQYEVQEEMLDPLGHRAVCKLNQAEERQ